MHVVYRQSCRVCGSTHLTPVIDLGDQYLQGSFHKPGTISPPLRRLPTQVVRCDVTRNEAGCGLVQLAHSFPPDILYANYWYRSGTNETMRRHLKGIVDAALALAPSGRLHVLDIGCNDGTLLGHYPAGFERFGVDPSDIAREIPPPIRVISSSFPSKVALRELGDRKFDVVTSIAMYYDLEDPVGFAQGVRSLLADNGVWIVEMSYLPLMLQTNAFDTICHEHIEYYSLAALETIMTRAGLRVFDLELNAINGGSIRCFITHSDNNRLDRKESSARIARARIREFEMALDTDAPYVAFRERIDAVKRELMAELHGRRARGQRIHLYGASTKGNVLLQWCGIDRDLIECAADRNPQKDGARTLGTDIPIVSEEKSRALRPDCYLVLPWHFRREFLEREAAAIRAGADFVFPLPTLAVVSAATLDAAIAGAEDVLDISL